MLRIISTILLSLFMGPLILIGGAYGFRHWPVLAGILGAAAALFAVALAVEVLRQVREKRTRFAVMPSQRRDRFAPKFDADAAASAAFRPLGPGEIAAR